MKISRAQVNEVLRSYLGRLESRPAGAVRTESGINDGVRLSSDVRRVPNWVKLAKALPEVRPELVGPLREALTAGTYQPGDDQVAAKIIERLLTDRAIEEQEF